MGNYLDLMLHFENQPLSFINNQEQKKQTLKSVCWLKTSNLPNELQDDSYIAIGGDDHLIHIISIKRTKVIMLLQGHTDSVIDLVNHPSNSRILLSVSKDNSIRLWDIHSPSEQCLMKWEVNANVAIFTPNGNSFICGCNNGIIKEFKLPDLNSFIYTRNNNDEYLHSPTILKMYEKRHLGNIDCLHFIKSNNYEKLISKSSDGKIFIWDISSGLIFCEIRVSNCKNISSKFGVSLDGQLLCVGNAEGIVYVYSTENGKLIHKFEHKRSKHPVRSCTFSKDLKNILYVTNDSHIWRFDYISSDFEHAKPQQKLMEHYTL